MSLLKKAARALKKVGKVALGTVKSVAPAAIGITPIGGAVAAGLGVGKVAGSALGSAAARLIKKAPSVVRSMPGVGTAAAGAVAGYAVENYIDGSYTMVRRRRRRKGISARDLTSFKRVARLIDKFAAPVHKLRKSSFKTAR